MTAAATTGAYGAGYWPTGWPVECGGNHRPKTAPGPGLAIEPTDRLVATTRLTGRWPVMFVARDRGELFLHGTTDGAGAGAASWVERVDPVTLAPVAATGDLPTGDHEWAGGIAVHANGDLYAVSGSFIHRLDPDCGVVVERQLPVDAAHNGLLVLSDGSLVTKDIRLGGGPSTLTVLDADLQVVTTERLPEASMGRLAAQHVVAAGADAGEGFDELYVPGSTAIHRYRWNGRALTRDPGWQPVYRTPGRGGLAWDPTIEAGRLWFHDNGNIPAVERRFADHPVEADAVAASGSGARKQGASDDTPPWTDPVRLIGVDLADDGDTQIIAPTELPAGWVIAPPLVTAGVAVAWDTGNTGLAAFDVAPESDGGLRGEMQWFQPFRSSMQPLLFPATGELVTNDFRYLEDGTTSDDLVVIDLATGRMKARISTGASRYSGMFLTPGWERDLYYCSFGTVARIRVEPF